MLPHEYLDRVPHHWHTKIAERRLRRWNQPSRTDHFIARAACALVQTQVKEPEKVDEDQFMVKFGTKAVDSNMSNDPNKSPSGFDFSAYPPEVREWANLDQTEIDKAVWKGRLGKDVLVARITKEEHERIRKLPLEQQLREKRRIALEQKVAEEAAANGK